MERNYVTVTLCMIILRGVDLCKNVGGSKLHSLLVK